jgi:hypothetical protein
MIGLPSLSQLDRSTPTRIWLAVAPADRRCSFDRLAELARSVTDQDPTRGGHLFLFRSRGGDRQAVRRRMAGQGRLARRSAGAASSAQPAGAEESCMNNC